jgi:hypothetical protein
VNEIRAFLFVQENKSSGGLNLNLACSVGIVGFTNITQHSFKTHCPMNRIRTFWEFFQAAIITLFVMTLDLISPAPKRTPRQAKTEIQKSATGENHNPLA